MRHLSITTITTALVMLLGCSPIQEPWVTSDDQLADERSRSANEVKDLRDRLATSQIDR